MGIIDDLAAVWRDTSEPFLVHRGTPVGFDQLTAQPPIDLSQVKAGDVVALIGDFDPPSIVTLLKLIDLNAVIVPLTAETGHDHEYFFTAANVDVVIREGAVSRRANGPAHDLVAGLRAQGHGGLVLFSTGTTGRPKAILHDFSLFLERFATPRPALRTLNFLLFDHIGGINTLLHTLYNRGVVVAPQQRTVDSILATCAEYDVELLPTTPTFLRMMLMSGLIPDRVPPCIRIITYGTERMDQPTLDELCRALPDVDFRQTFGMSELGIVRVKSAARDSLFMRIGGPGIETKVDDGVLKIRSRTRMLGYLNAPSPFDADGWYNTNDVVEERDGLYKVVGRTSEVINVGGLKFMAAEVERVALEIPDVLLAKAIGRANPITGQHVELDLQVSESFSGDPATVKRFCQQRLQSHMVPRRVRFDDVPVGHRFKRL